MSRAFALSARSGSKVVALASLPTSIPVVLEPQLASIRGPSIQGGGQVIVSWVNARGGSKGGGIFGGEQYRTGIAWKIPTNSTPPDGVDSIAGSREGGRAGEGWQRATAGQNLVGEARSAGRKCYFPRSVHLHSAPHRTRHQ